MENDGKVSIEQQIKERKWRWIDHTLRKPQDATTKKVLGLEPSGHQEEG
jgi:hypothetical protein